MGPSPPKATSETYFAPDGRVMMFTTWTLGFCQTLQTEGSNKASMEDDRK